MRSTARITRNGAEAHPGEAASAYPHGAGVLPPGRQVASHHERYALKDASRALTAATQQTTTAAASEVTAGEQGRRIEGGKSIVSLGFGHTCDVWGVCALWILSVMCVLSAVEL